MKSVLLFSAAREKVELAIRDFINAQQTFLSARTADHPRAVGDAIQDLLASNLASLIGEEFCLNYTSKFARRSMADMAFDDQGHCHYIVDVKTHRIGAAFSMPNLTSVERLTRYYNSDDNYFIVLLVSYEVHETNVVAIDVKFVPIEFLDWSCLTIGALGWGQIQIANANKITINQDYSRTLWMLELCRKLLEFYPREVAKIDKRIDYFKKIESSWKAKPE